MTQAARTDATGMPPDRGMTRRWRARGESGEGPLVRRVLGARGLHDPDAAAAFIAASMSGLHEPALLADADKAAGRLLDAARTGEPIVIYGDYDVDGVCATAILWHTLRAIAPGCRVSSYVPHRLEEGYGLNEGAIREIVAGGARVIVTVDCGVSAVGPARVAKDLGACLIITDHHTPPGEGQPWPEAHAIVHPRRPGQAYPFGELCGAGVAFKVAWRLASLASGGGRVSEHLRGVLLRMLPLAAIATVADVVPLVGENRVLVKAGLRAVRHSDIPGLRALVEASGLAGEHVAEEEAGFKLAPRLNACGRLGHARDAVELFTTAEGERAVELADILTRVNRERQATEARIVEEAKDLARRAGMTGDDRRAIVLASPGWHAGVVGIVCSKLVEAFGRPTILLCERDGVCHGSGRSIDGFSLYGALARCEAHLTKWGGHDMAAGLTLPAANLPAFVEAFMARANEEIAADDLVPTAWYDTRAVLAELTPDSVREVERLAPFGRENPRVQVRVDGLRIAGPPNTFGGGKHLDLRVTHERGGGYARLVWWGMGHAAGSVPSGTFVEAIVTPKLNTYKGSTTVEGHVVDLRVGA